MQALPERIHRYETPVFDSARWDGFRARPGDVIVATPVKSGTTWTQMISALLIHQTTDFPEPLTRLSRWLDRHAEPIEEVLAHFEQQQFRRLIKTHTPLDGLPYFPEAHYIFCGRDPRDVLLSMLDHVENTSAESRAGVLSRMGLPPGAEFPKLTPNDAFAMWLTTPAHPWLRDGFPYGSVLSLTETYWQFRHLPNIHFLHYADLLRDLEGEMRRLAQFLRIEIDAELWPRLLRAASFEAMKEDAAKTAPGAHFAEWKNAEDFFRKGRIGEWRTVLSRDNLDLYERISGTLPDPRMKVWLEGGRAVAGDPKTLP